MGSQEASGLAVREIKGGPSSKGQQTCPRCGQTNPNTAVRCRSCLVTLVVETTNAEDRLLDQIGEELADDLFSDLESAVSGTTRAPRMKGKVAADVPVKKKELLAFLQGIPGVSSLAAHSAYGFFQDLDQITLAEAEDLAALPGVSREEAKRILKATGNRKPPKGFVCPSCGRPLAVGAATCLCGTVFEATGDAVRYECPACGNPVSETAQSCGCGATFS